MSKRKRRHLTAEFKARVALEALKEERQTSGAIGAQSWPTRYLEGIFGKLGADERLEPMGIDLSERP